MIFEDLYDVTYDAENYIISAKTNNKYINIFENSSGLHIKSGYSLETLDDTKINIPSFDGYSHQRNLKILFHEVMVNVLPNGFTPNYLTYGNFWYRDGAIISMVLKETNNLDQMKLNVDPTKFYDGARGGVDEADNLGELLFMLSLMEEKDWDTINAVLDEAHRIKKGDCIYGYTDGGLLYVYQTTWLKYGMDCLGIDSSEYVVEGKADSYSNMCWWYKRDIPKNYPYDAENMEKILFDPSKMYFPYLDIARLHYYQVKIDIPHLLMYPISFEMQDWGLNGKVAYCSPHSWTASELFLYLLDYDNF